MLLQTGLGIINTTFIVCQNLRTPLAQERLLDLIQFFQGQIQPNTILNQWQHLHEIDDKQSRGALQPIEPFEPDEQGEPGEIGELDKVGELSELGEPGEPFNTHLKCLNC